MKKLFFLLLLTVFFYGSVMAVPAFPEKIIFTQPGSETTVSIYLKGDERVHWAETVDGYSLLHSSNGSLVYARCNDNGDMVATDFLATEIDARSKEVEAFLKKTPKHLHFSQRQVDEMLSIWKQVENAKSGPKTMSNVIGYKKFLVILFEFSDREMTHSKMEFKELFNQVNYTAGGRTGSVRDYYYDVSGGLFTLKVDVVGPFTGAYNTAYYGATDYGSQAFAREAVDSAANYVDFSDYDNDNDGYIDGLHIIFAGYGEEAGASSDCIWSHKWNIFDAPTYNNTVVDVYSCSPECNSYYGGKITNIGVICHELGHVFGAPDYYDTDYSGSGGEYPGLGQWDIMSSGSWNRGGITPAHHNPYTKIYIYHWATCDTIDGTPKTVVMSPTDVTNGNFHRINTSTQGDFFLIENRQKVKWDKFLPGNGMLVYHIHPSAYGANVSNSRHPQQIYILAKTNETDSFPTNSPSSYGNLNSATATFPGDYGRRYELTDNSVPWFRPWSGVANNIPFYNISENSSTKQLFLTVGNASPDPMDAEAEGIDQQTIALRWKKYGNYNTMIVANTDANSFGTPEGHYNVGDTVDGGGIVIYKGNSSNTLATDLLNNHLYHFRLYSCKNDTTYSNGIYVQGQTLNCSNFDWQNEDFESTACGILPECWSGNWNVDSVMGQKAMVSFGEGWQIVSCRPFSFDTLHNAVLHFKLNFNNLCDETSCLKTEYRENASAEWVTVDSTIWMFGSATWRDIYLQLPNAGDRSRIRFSAYSVNGAQIAIDNVEINKGSLIFASSDNNGDIHPRGYSVLAENDTIKYTIIPISGHDIDHVELDGHALAPYMIELQDNGTYSYKLHSVVGPHTVKAIFKRKATIDNVLQENIVVYPNPAESTITVVTKPGQEITIYDIMGHQTIRQKSCSETLTINIQHLSKGIYMLRCGDTVTKVIKK